MVLLPGSLAAPATPGSHAPRHSGTQQAVLGSCRHPASCIDIIFAPVFAGQRTYGLFRAAAVAAPAGGPVVDAATRSPSKAPKKPRRTKAKAGGAPDQRIATFLQAKVVVAGFGSKGAASQNGRVLGHRSPGKRGQFERALVIRDPARILGGSAVLSSDDLPRPLRVQRPRRSKRRKRRPKEQAASQQGAPRRGACFRTLAVEPDGSCTGTRKARFNGASERREGADRPLTAASRAW
jgi:hypothetical protein